MSDHKPECPMLDEQWPKHPLEKCPYCDMISACERRALDAAREAVKGVKWFNDEGKMLNAIVATADAIAAIDSLREKP